MKREPLAQFSQYEMDGDIDEVIKKLADVKKKFKKLGYIKIRMDIEDEWGYYDEHNIIIKITGEKELKNGRDLFKK